MNKLVLAISTLMLAITSGCAKMNSKDMVVIAHRGAPGYLPEHTLAGKALAYEMGADFIEQDVLITKDNQAVVLHDIYLDAVTNVSEVFPGRARSDGHFYVVDFSLAELKTLNINERIDLKSKRAVYPKRFPVFTSSFPISTLTEEIELIQGLNKSTGRNIGIYTEIKSPAWHRLQGKDISKIVLDILSKKGYKTKTDNIYVQCFDPIELKRLRSKFKSQLKLIQLIDDNQGLESDADYEYLQTPKGLKEISEYADGIGPWLPQILTGRNKDGSFVFSALTENAHRYGLLVHAYTLRKDDLPPLVSSFSELMAAILNDSFVDGVFTDFPDYVVAAKRDHKPI